MRGVLNNRARVLQSDSTIGLQDSGAVQSALPVAIRLAVPSAIHSKLEDTPPSSLSVSVSPSTSAFFEMETQIKGRGSSTTKKMTVRLPVWLIDTAKDTAQQHELTLTDLVSYGLRAAIEHLEEHHELITD